MFKALIQKIESNPKNLFLIDGLGAILSVFLLGVVLVRFEGIFGIPASVLYFLASIPFIFVAYDFFSYLQDNHTLGPYLKGIAMMNLMYCCLSIGIIFYHKEVIKFWGWYYIISEVVIILILVFIELRIARKIILKKAYLKK